MVKQWTNIIRIRNTLEKFSNKPVLSRSQDFNHQVAIITALFENYTDVGSVFYSGYLILSARRM